LKHLQILRDGGLIIRRRVGTSIYDQISDPTVFKLCELACRGAAKNPQRELNELGVQARMESHKINLPPFPHSLEIPLIASSRTQPKGDRVSIARRHKLIPPTLLKALGSSPQADAGRPIACQDPDDENIL
jgi:hypothetical protein